MIWQVSCGHFLSCCLENYFCKNKEVSKEVGTVGTHWNSNDLTKKVSPKLHKNVINQKLHHFAYLVCTICLKEHIHNQSWILHLIDEATRYSAACLINTKHQDEKTMSRIYSMWIAYFGCPGKLLSDNGGEFNKDSYREINEELNVDTATTAAESPFNNGIVERHNLILVEDMQKTLLGVNCEPQIALAWAVSAKKCPSESRWI